MLSRKRPTEVSLFWEVCSRHWQGKLLLPDQAWVRSPDTQQTQSVYWRWVVVKGWNSVYCRDKQGDWATHAQKAWTTPSDSFQRRVLKSPCKGEGHRLRDQLVLSSAIGWWCGNEVVFQESWSSTSGSNWSEVYELVVSMQLTSPHLVEVLLSAKQLKDMAQVYSPWGETKSPWLYFRLNCYFVLLGCFPLFLHFLSSLITFALWNFGEAWEIKAFL